MKKVYLYPFWLRFWHWLNAILFLVLIVSGLSLHFSDPSNTIVSFRLAMVSHNLAGIILSINYLLFFVQSIISGNIKHYIPKLKGFIKRLMLQMRYYVLGIFIGEPHPFHSTKVNKFNPMQQVAYLFIMFLFMPIVVISGFLLMFPEYAPDQLFGMGGLWPMAFAHSITGYILSLFMLSHIYLATTGGTLTELVKSMLTGWHLEHEEEEEGHRIESPAAKSLFRGRKLFPIIFYNPLTLTGAIATIISFLLIIFLMLVEFFSPDSNPYLGIITFVLLPTILLFGLLLISWGAIKENRRLLQMAEKVKRLPIIDLNNPKHQVATLVFSVGTIIIVVMSIFGSFKAYEYTDSDEFCGKVCHKVMEPEYIAYLDSPHSRVGCVKCHIGSGADWFVRAKLSGTYQVYSVLFNKYSRPIPTPVHNLRPAAQTCEQCHWPKHFYNEKKKNKRYFLPDENNSEYQLNMLVKVGGGSHETGNNEGIHYVMNIANEVSYIAIDDKRNIIPWVKTVSRIDGKERVYRDTTMKFNNDLVKPENIRVMDCIDCHNRPSHIYNNPSQVLNIYMINNTLDKTLPFIKRIGVQALETYATKKETAKEDIKRFASEYYKNYHADIYLTKTQSIKNAIELLYKIFQRDYFPYMKANWKNYPNNIGHMYSPGCFRCHDGKHVSNDGKVISNDCNVCHLMVYQKHANEPAEESTSGLKFVHPGGIDKIADTKNCVNCHGAYPKSKDVINFTKK